MWLPFTQDMHRREQHNGQNEREGEKKRATKKSTNCCPNSLFLFVGVSSLFFVSQSRTIPSEQEQHWKRSEPEPSRQVHNRRCHVYLMIFFTFCSLLFLSLSQCALSLFVSLLRIIQLPGAGTYSMYSRPNVLVVLLYRKLSFSSDIQNGFFSLCHLCILFTFDTWMNVRSDGLFCFVLHHRGLCLHGWR